jgi:seryl-tRNA synthetase
MAETKAELENEVSELRERIRVLEEDLKHAKHKDKKDRADLTDTVDKLADQMNKLTRGVVFAAMEALSVSADMTKEFVQRTDARSTPERRDTWAKLMTDFPMDMSKGMVDALKSGVDDTEKVIDKFYAKYKE